MKLSVNDHVPIELAYVGHKGDRFWGEPVPYLDDVPDAHGKPARVLLEGVWWTQTRMKALLLWMDDARTALRRQLGQEFARATIDPNEATPIRDLIRSFLADAMPRSARLRRTIRADPATWTIDDLIRGACMSSRLLLQLAERGVIRHAQNLIPTPEQMRARDEVMTHG